MTFDLGYVWRGDGAQGTYELFIPTQPVIQSEFGTVTIHAPSGMTIASTSPGMSVEGSSATWRGSMSATPHVSHAVRAGRARTSLVGPQERVLGGLTHRGVLGRRSASIGIIRRFPGSWTQKSRSSRGGGHRALGGGGTVGGVAQRTIRKGQDGHEMNDRDPLHFCTFSLVTIQSLRSRIHASTGRKVA